MAASFASLQHIKTKPLTTHDVIDAAQLKKWNELRLIAVTRLGASTRVLSYQLDQQILRKHSNILYPCTIYTHTTDTL